jgi:hypothetical protein
MRLQALLLAWVGPVYALSGWQRLKSKSAHRGIATCKNHYGQDVDWWFILEASGDSKRYIYFDSKMAQVSDVTGKAPRFMPVLQHYYCL